MLFIVLLGACGDLEDGRWRESGKGGVHVMFYNGEWDWRLNLPAADGKDGKCCFS